MAEEVIVTATIAGYAGGTVVTRFIRQGGGSPAVITNSANINSSGEFSLLTWNNSDPAYSPSLTQFRIATAIPSVATDYSVNVSINSAGDISAAFSGAPSPPTPGSSGGIHPVMSVGGIFSW